MPKAKTVNVNGISTCDRAARFFKRIGIAIAILIGAVVWISGVGNILRNVFAFSAYDTADPYFLALISSVFIGVIGVALAGFWYAD